MLDGLVTFVRNLLKRFQRIRHPFVAKPTCLLLLKESALDDSMSLFRRGLESVNRCSQLLSDLGI